MSKERSTEQDKLPEGPFRNELREPSVEFSNDTLAVIRTIVAESPGETKADASDWSGQHERSFSEKSGPCEIKSASHQANIPLFDTGTEQFAGQIDEIDYTEPSFWRHLKIVEAAPGRFVRFLMTSPRGLALVLMGGVTIWRPLFIPIFAFLLLFAVLLVGVFVGQDRMGRIMLYFFKRYIWADPARGQSLQRILPASWHRFLYKPITEEDAWEGPVDPRFAARLARLSK